MLTRKKIIGIAVPIIGVSIFAFVHFSSKNNQKPQILPESDVALESSNTSIDINSSNSSNDLNLPNPNPTDTSSSASNTSIPSSSNSTPTYTSSPKPISTSTSETQPTATSTSEIQSTPNDSGTSSNEPDSDNSSSSTSSPGFRPVFIPQIYMHAKDCKDGWVGLKSDHIGDAYIDGDFLRENRIDKVKNGRKINGWKFNLYIDDALISLIVYSDQGRFSYGTQTIYYETPTYEHFVDITSAEYTENDQLKISFSIEDASLDLTALDDISVTFSTTLASSTSSNAPPIDDDYYNGWVKLTDGQTGDAYIYGSFLDENDIGKVVNGHKINGWKINLYTHTVSISLFVYPNQNGFYYRAKQITTYEDAPTLEWPVQITTEYTDNSDLIVSFSVEDYAFDLSSLYRVTIEAC